MNDDASLILPLLGRNSSALGKSEKNVIGARFENKTKTMNEVIEINPIGVKTIALFEQISSASKAKLKRRYSKELSLFGYGFNTKRNTVTCAVKGFNNTICC